MTGAGAHWCVPEKTRTRYGNPLSSRSRRTSHHFSPIEILISNGEEIEQFILRLVPVGGIAGTVRDHPSDLALRTTQSHQTGDPGAARRIR